MEGQKKTGLAKHLNRYFTSKSVPAYI